MNAPKAPLKFVGYYNDADQCVIHNVTDWDSGTVTPEGANACSIRTRYDSGSAIHGKQLKLPLPAAFITDVLAESAPEGEIKLPLIKITPAVEVKVSKSASATITQPARPEKREPWELDARSIETITFVSKSGETPRAEVRLKGGSNLIVEGPGFKLLDPHLALMREGDSYAGARRDDQVLLGRGTGAIIVLAN